MSVRRTSYGGRLRAVLIAFAAVVCATFAFGAAVAQAASVANDVFVGTNDETPVVVHFNASGDAPLTYSIVDNPLRGTLSSLSQENGTVVYTADSDFAGVDTFAYSADDGTGPAEATATITVRPSTGIAGPTGLINTSTPTYDLSSPQDGTVFQCRIDDGPFTLCESPYTTPSLGEGAHTIAVRARVGTSGPVDPTPAVAQITVDTIAPTVNLERAAGQSAHTNVTPISFALTADEDLDDPTVSVDDFEVTGGTIDQITGGGDQYTITVQPGAEGDVTIDTSDDFEVADLAGNVTDTAGGTDRTVEYDVTAPLLSLDPPSSTSIAKPALAFSSPDDPEVTYECRVYATDTDSEELPEYQACVSPFLAPFLDRNTNYTFELQGTDLAGNETTDSIDWDELNTAPVAPAPDLTVEAGQNVNVPLGSTDADGDTLSYEVTSEVTGGTIAQIDQDTGDVTFTAAGDAAGNGFGFGFTASDGREAGTTASTTSIKIQPNTVFSVEPPAETNDTTPTWEFNSPAGAATFECSFDGGPWEACDDGSYTADELGEGLYTFDVRATIGGLTDPTPAHSEVRIDTGAPDVTLLSSPITPSTVTDPVFEFESSDPTATFECSVDGVGTGLEEGDESVWGACVSGDALDLAEGEHTFQVRAVDPGGNASTPASYDYEVDLTDPVIDVSSGPRADGAWTNQHHPAWEFVTSDKNLVPDSARCKVDARDWVEECASPWQSNFNLPDGQHSVTIEVDDVAGNTGTFSVDFLVNSITPTVIIDEAPGSPSGPNASFKFHSTTDLGEGGGFECRISHNGGGYGAWEACAGETTLTDLTSGSRTIQVRAIDAGGNVSTGGGIASYTWSTVGGVPDTVITGSSKTGTSASFAFNAPGYPLATFACAIDGGSLVPCTSPKSFSGLSAGSHTFRVVATNEVGTIDPTPAADTFSVVAPTAPNTIIDVKPSAKTASTGASFEFSASVPVATFECNLDGSGWSACTSPATFSGLTVGDHTFEVRAKGENGMTDSSPASAVWQIVNPTPGPQETCNPVAPKSVNGRAVKLAKGLKVSVQLSHSRAIEGQTITAKLLANGKSPNKAQKKRLKKLLRKIDLNGKGGVVSSLKAGAWSGTFQAGSKSPGNVVVKLVRKKGTAMRTTVPFTLTACSE